MIYSFEQLNIAHHLMSNCEQEIFEKTGIKVRLRMNNSTIEGKQPKEMMQVIAASLGLRIEDYLGGKKTSLVELRFITALFIRQHWPELSLEKIGELFGGQDHTTVRNAIIVSESYLENGDQKFTAKYNTAKSAIDKWLSEGK